MVINLKEPINDKPFEFIDPPFNFNADSVNAFAPEITGNVLLQSLCARLEWRDLSDKLLLDFGCGVRFVRTIINLAIDVGLYVGIDVNEECIAWLQSNIDHPNIKFYHLNMMNPLYRPHGNSRNALTLPTTDAHGRYDAACMFSVITHQGPDDSKAIFSLLHDAVRPGGQMYFTAFLDEAIAEYEERVPDQPSMQCYYNPSLLCDLAEGQGWKVVDVYRKSKFQQYGIRCRKE